MPRNWRVNRPPPTLHQCRLHIAIGLIDLTNNFKIYTRIKFAPPKREGHKARNNKMCHDIGNVARLGDTAPVQYSTANGKSKLNSNYDPASN